MPDPPHTAYFRFFGPLNDFLAPLDRQTDVAYRFWGTPAVKDAIEALGVPHPEVYYLQSGERAIGFGHALQHGTRTCVYPRLRTVAPAAGMLRAPPPTPPRFVLDVHLGQLARYLRMLGFDTRYQNDFADAAIARIAQQEARIVLTRDVGLLKRNRVMHGAFLRATDPEAQLRETLDRFEARPHAAPMTRCLQCNGHIETVEKEVVMDEIPPRTRQAFNAFFRCADCGQVYWKGAHYARMQSFIERVLD